MKKKRIGIVGCGAIGEGVALFIDKELCHKVSLWAIADKNIKKATELKKRLRQIPKIVGLNTLIKEADLIIEAASQKCAEDILRKTRNLEREVIILSVGALINNRLLLEGAISSKAKIYIPSGAICGVDGIGALALGNIRKICLSTSKPPSGLLGSTYIKRKKIDLTNIKEEKIIFEGSAKEAIKYFPQNINVAATLFLASSFSSKGGLVSGGKDVKVSIKANPALKRNVHRIEIQAKEANLNIEVENVPSETNPKTSTLAILSTKYLLKKIFSSFKIGS